eukprot:5109607-Alexandrium_andersonii.AAC.1
MAAIRAEGRESKGIEVNGLHLAFRELFYLKEAFGEAARELILETSSSASSVATRASSCNT